MNEIYARRLAQSNMFHQLMRSHSTLWAATQVTKEPLDYNFIKEEFMRTNGKRMMPLLIGASSEENMSETHFSHLTENYAWTESSRAYAVQRQTPLTQHIASMGRMAETLNQGKTYSTAQTLFNEHISRLEGITHHDEEPLLNDDDE